MTLSTFTHLLLLASGCSNTPTLTPTHTHEMHNRVDDTRVRLALDDDPIVGKVPPPDGVLFCEHLSSWFLDVLHFYFLDFSNFLW